ncbi:MAG: hypothetical protein NTW88_06970 [Actinobacteria bacterium]|nr:hypothetical protein [Actinomycetota bacterium]
MKRISIIAATLILASCSASTTDTSSSTSPTGDDDVTLTLLAHESFTPTEGIFDAFTEQTGIKVEIVRSGDAGELVTGNRSLGRCRRTGDKGSAHCW